MQPYEHDLWAPLSFKPPLDQPGRPDGFGESWVDDLNARRLTAYRILAAYADNCARYWLPTSMWIRPAVRVPSESDMFESFSSQVAAGRAPAEKYREYGHAGALVAAARALVLGEKPAQVHVPDAVPVPDDAPDEDKAVQERAELFLDWLRGWADDERLWLRLLEGEDKSVKLGDGVYALGWDTERRRPRLRVYDPGWYFPVLTGDQDTDEFPDKVHVAYEELQEDGTVRLFRRTWSRELLPDGESVRYPWQGEDEEPSRFAVFYSFAWWDLDKVNSGQVNGKTVFNLSEEAAEFVTAADGVVLNRRQLPVDFVPVVHVPNDAAGANHFGRSILLLVAQILDDLAGTDTDLQFTADNAASPPLAVAQPGAPMRSGPGAVVQTGTAYVDTSKNLDALLKFDEHLLQLLSIVSRIAEALLGRVKPNEVPSGYALELGFAATRALVEEMRAVRDEKFPLLLKMALRWAQAAGPDAGGLPPGPTPRAELPLGPYLPADKAAAVDQASAALRARAISTLTAVQHLIANGWDIEDAEAEVERINAENFEAAVRLFEATGDEAAVGRFLGIQVAATPPTPEPPATS